MVIVNAVIYYNFTILSRLLTKYEVSGNANDLGQGRLSGCLRAQLLNTGLVANIGL